MEFMRSERIYRRPCGNRHILIAALCLFILLSLPLVCKGEGLSTTRFISQDQGGALSITSRKMTLNNQENTIVFEGDVVIERETMTLKANVVQAVFEPVTERENGMIENSDRKRSLSAITATGDIEFNQGVRTVYANRVVYFKKDEKMVFTGSPNIREGDDELKGEKITVFIKEDRVVVEGGEAIIHPK